MTSLLDVFFKPVKEVPNLFTGIVSGEFSGTAYTGTGTAANGTGNGTGNGNGGETDAERAARVAAEKLKRKNACLAKNTRDKGWTWDDRGNGLCTWKKPSCPQGKIWDRGRQICRKKRGHDDYFHI